MYNPALISRLCCRRWPSYNRLYTVKVKTKAIKTPTETLAKIAKELQTIPKRSKTSKNSQRSTSLESLDPDQTDTNQDLEAFEYWSSFADQSTSATNNPDREIQQVTYSYISTKQEEAVKEPQNKQPPTIPRSKDDHYTTTYSVSVNNGRLRFILPKLDITKTWNLLDLDRASRETGGRLNIEARALTAKLKHLEKLGRNFQVIKASQILFVQKYRLQPPVGSVLQKLENVFNIELRNHNLADTRFVLEIKTTNEKDGSSKVERHEIPTQHHTFFTYLGLASVENSQKLATSVLYRFLRKCTNETLKQDLWDSNKVEFEKENLSALREIDKSLIKEVPPCHLNEAVFLSSSRPILLRFNGANLTLPSLPNIRAASEFPYLLELVFGDSHMQDEQSKERVRKVSEALDKVGDRILHILAQEYYYQRKVLFDSLSRSNALLGRLVHLYDFPLVNLRANKEKGNFQPLDESELERLGDIFEKFIAITFMTDSQACLKWLFGIFDTIHEAIMISLYQKDVQSFTDGAKLNLRFKPKAPEIEYVSKGIGESVEKFVFHLINTKSAEMRSIRRSFKVDNRS